MCGATRLATHKISIVIVGAAGVLLYLHQDRLGQLFSVDYFDGDLLTCNTMDPQLDQS